MIREVPVDNIIMAEEFGSWSIWPKLERHFNHNFELMEFYENLIEKQTPLTLVLLLFLLFVTNLILYYFFLGVRLKSLRWRSALIPREMLQLNGNVSLKKDCCFFKIKCQLKNFLIN